MTTQAHVFTEPSIHDLARKLANEMLPNVDEAKVDACTVVVRVGTKSYDGYLKGKTALLIGKCENDKNEKFAIFVTH